MQDESSTYSLAATQCGFGYSRFCLPKPFAAVEVFRLIDYIRVVFQRKKRFGYRSQKSD